MTIVLLILKIIGIVLLVFLGLIVLLALLVLFVPVRYRAQGGYHREEPWSAQVKVSWLLHAVSITADLRAEGNEIGLRIFGIKKKLDNSENSENFSDSGEDIERTEEPGPKEREEYSPPGGNVQFVKEERITSSEDAEGMEAGAEESRVRKPERKHFFGKIAGKLRDLKQKLSDTAKRIRAAVKNFSETVRRFKELLTDGRNHSAVRFLGGRLFYMLKKLMPRKLVLDLQYSTGAPDTTGELLGVIAMFPIGYQNCWSVTPDFEADEAYVETDFEVQGRIFLFRFMGVGISILTNKDCRYLYKKLKTIF